MPLLLKICIFPAIQSAVGALASFNAVLSTAEFQEWVLENFDRTGWPNDFGEQLRPFILGGSLVSVGAIREQFHN